MKIIKNKSACLKIWTKIVAHCNANALLKKHSRILLAVSGGPDSVCMAHFFTYYGRNNGLDIIMCHLNHGIRGKNADKDADFVKNLGKKLGIKTILCKADTPAFAKKSGLSMEHAARKLRYKTLTDVALKNKCGMIATAHHLDDQAETFILHLIRGTSAAGLAGIPVRRTALQKPRNEERGTRNSRTPQSNLKSVFIIRPLLCLAKKEILGYLKSAGLGYRKDETNDSDKHTRNWIRNRLIPLIEKKQPQFKRHVLEISAEISKLL